MFLFALLAACTSSPESIRVEDPLLIFDMAPQSPELAALDADGEVLEDVEVTMVSSSDPDVLELGKGGVLRCAGTGEATLSLSAGGVSKDVTVQCAIVKELRVLPKALSHVMVPDAEGAMEAKAFEPLKVEVVGMNDELTSAVPLRANSSDEAVAKVDGKTIQAVGPGRATVTYMAGDKTVEVQVEVAEEVLAKVDLLVPSRDQRGFPLEAGRYRATAGSDAEVALSFSGTDCETERSTSPSLECTLDGTATVVVENHPGLSFGSDAKVKLRVVRLP